MQRFFTRFAATFSSMSLVLLHLTGIILPVQIALAATRPSCNGSLATIWVNTDNNHIMNGTTDTGVNYAGTLNGTNGADIIVGSSGADTINGNNQNDTICGGNGNDTIDGGSGSDWIDGEGGNDTVDGGNGTDTLFGGDGDDRLLGANGGDTMTGGNGNDFCNQGNGPGVDCDAEVGQGLIQIVKDAVPNSAQDFAFTGGLGAFSLDDDADGTLPNAQSFGKVPGTYAVTETAVAGWNLTNLVCTDSISNNSTVNVGTRTASINVSADEIVVCTYTNTSTQGNIIVTKQVTNDNGGTKVVGNFTLKVDGNTVTSGASTAVVTGAHVVSEDADSGYTGTIGGDCDANGNVTVGPGETKNCTITNDDKPGKLTVTKVVTNNDGGTKVIGNFTLQIDGNTVTSGVENTLNAGVHTVSEVVDPEYAGVIGGDCAADGTVSVGNGETKSCTITNDDRPAKLIVTKVVTNDNGGTKTVANFSLFVDGNPVTSGAENSFLAGAHVISEGPDSAYAGTIGGDCDANGNVTLVNGQTKNCTITNDDKPGKVTVTKLVTNNNGGAKVVANFTLRVDGGVVTSGAENIVNAGVHTVSEDADSGYAGTIGGDCAADGTVTVGNGETKNCTITNDDKPGKLIVIKEVTNDDGGGKNPGDFVLYVNGNPVTNGAENTVDAGAHIVSEDADSEYAGTIGGDCDVNGNVTVGNGETKTCTITNDDRPAKLIVTKVVTNDSGGSKDVADFSLFVDGNAVTSGVENSFLAGAHVVSEGADSGYTGTFSGDCDTGGNVTLINGQTKTCTITNDDNPGKLIVTKIVTNDDGGAKEIEDFTLQVDGDAVTSGTENTVDAGIHTVSEVADSGYIGTIGGDCAADGTVTVGNGETKSCTITNDDKPGKLIVTKILQNDNGGAKVVADFTLRVDGDTVTSGAENIVDAGAHIVSEDADSGYVGTIGGDCDEEGNVTVGNGETKTCTITNDDNPGKLIVIKEVTNDSGGEKTAGDFTLRVNGNVVTNGAENTLDAGIYTVSEDADTGYTATLSGDCAADGTVTVGNGETKTCTITNDDNPGTLTVVKIVTNDNGGAKEVSDFTLRINDDIVTSGAGNTVNAGSYTVSEDADSGYTGTFSGDCDAEGNVTVGNGETKTCTITNDDKPGTLTVVKNVTNDDGGVLEADDFTINVTGTNASPASFPGDSDGTAVTLDAGAYSVDEEENSGYEKSLSEDCSGTIANGEAKTCTITNDDKEGTLIVTKEVTNDNGGAKVIADFVLRIDGNPVTSGNSNGVSAGTHTVSEDVDTGYAGTIGGDCDAEGKVTVGNGETKTCTIMNDDKTGTLIVTKVVTNDNGGTLEMSDFSLFVDENAVTSGAENVVNAGSYTVSETSVEGYEGAFGGDCDAEGNVTVGNGETKNCILTNDDQSGHLVILKSAVGGDDTFNFTVKENGNTVATPGIITSAGNGTADPVDIDSNTDYTIEEPVLPAGWDFTSVDCEYEGEAVGNAGPGPTSHVVNVDPGETVTCTYTNTKRGSITVSKDVVAPDGSTEVSDGHQFTVTLDGGSGQSIAEGDNFTYENLVPGQYTIAENADADYDFVSADIDEDSETPGAQVTVVAGQNIGVVLKNAQKKGQLTISKQIYNHGIGTADANDFSFHLNGGAGVAFAAEEGNSYGQNTVEVDPGTYGVTESGPEGYAGTFSDSQDGSCANIVIPSNGSASCMIANSDIPNGQGSITVIKALPNDNGGTALVSDFPLWVTLNGEEPGDPVSVTSGQAAFFAPGNYTVSETNPGEIGGYTESINCVSGEISNNTGTLNLGEQQAWVCTITNDDDAPSLTLVKEVTVDNGGNADATDWTLSAAGPTPISGAGGVSSDATFEAGTYTLSESGGPEGYTASAWSCTKNEGDPVTGSSIELGLGDFATCTITNDDEQAHLTIVKETDGGDGTFDFTVSGAGEFSENVELSTTEGVASSEPIALDAGSYNVTETVPEGWTFAGVSCVYENESIGTSIENGEQITVGPGDEVTCTFSNTKRAVLIVKKVVINDNTGTSTADDFSFQVNGGEPIVFIQEENPLEGENDLIVDPGTYTVTELAASGYASSLENCNEIALEAGETATCTITNNDVAPSPPSGGGGGGGGGGGSRLSDPTGGLASDDEGLIPDLPAPETPLVRGFAACMMLALVGESVDDVLVIKKPFPDVGITSQYAKCIQVAKKLGIVEGYGDGWFRPMRHVSKAEGMVMLHRALHLQFNATVSLPPCDDLRISERPWWLPIMKFGYANGIYEPFDASCSPEEVIDRGTFNVFLAKFQAL